MIKEKDSIREEIMKKFLNSAGKITEDDYAKKYHEVMKKNEELLSKNENLMIEKDMLNKELNRADRGHNETAIKIKELSMKYEKQISDLEDNLKKVNMRLYQKEALIAKVTTENEYLAQENFRLKSVHNINDSLIRLPETCFIDIQSAKQQREAVHEATKKLVEEMASEQYKAREDILLKNIAELESKNKQTYLSMYDSIGLELNKYEVDYQYKNKAIVEERKKDEALKEEKEQIKTEFRYKLGAQDRTYEDFVKDQLEKNHKFGKEFKIDTKNVDDLLVKYNM